jgi:hypothetical protein
MSIPQLCNNGVCNNLSVGHSGSIYSAASQNQINNSTKLNNLNGAIKGGKKMKKNIKRGGAIPSGSIEVPAGYTSVYPQAQFPSTGNIGANIASTQNAAFVQRNHDIVPLVQPTKGGRKIFKSRRFKSIKNKSRKNRTRRNRK